MNTTSESLLFRLKCDANGQPMQTGHAIDEAAWKEFVEIYTPLIFYWARKMGLKSSDASDLVQDVLTLAFQKLPDFQYDQQQSFRGWLRTVTLNKYRETFRRKSAQQAVASHSVLEQLQALPRAESTWDLDYARILVAETMKTLKTDFATGTWDALTMVVGENRSVDEAAEKTGVSVWTIYSAKSRLMKRLRERLKGLL